MFPAYGSTTRRPASLHRVLTGRVPLLRRYDQDATTPCRSFRRFTLPPWSCSALPSFGGTADGRLRFRGHRRQTPVTRGSWVTRIAPLFRGFVRKRFLHTPALVVFSHVPGEPPLCRYSARRPRQDRSHQAILGASVRPPFKPRRRLLRELSLEAQSHGLGTRGLRFAGWITPPPRKTRFRLPAKLYRTGLLPAGFQRKVSEMSPT